MKDGKKFARIMAILLAVLLLITFIVPAFAMFAYAANPKTDGDAFIINFETEDGDMLRTWEELTDLEYAKDISILYI